jgi:PAS domain S-box-containing protein
MPQRRSFTDLSSQFLQSLASVSLAGFFRTDAEGRATYVNHQWTVISGQPAHRCHGFGWLDAIHPDDRERVLRGWRESASAARQYITSYRVVRPSGEIRHVQVRIAPVEGIEGEPPSYVGSVEDVTDRQVAEGALRELMHAREESQRRIQALFDNSLDAIVFADDQGRFVDANPAACALFGCSYDDLLTQTVPELSAGSAAEFHQSWRAFLDSGRQSGEHLVRRADGQTRAVEFRAVANVLPGTHLSIMRDITERRATQQVQHQYTKRLEILAAIDCAILAPSSPETIADAAVTQIAQLFPAVRVSVTLFDHLHGIAWIAALWSDRPTQIDWGRQFPVSESGTLLAEVRPVIVEDLARLPERTPVDSILLEEGIRSYIRVPMCVPDEVIGSLNISSGQAGALSDEHRRVAQEIADRLAVALRDARLFEDVQSSARQLSMLSKRLLEVQERERRDFARELHDDVGQLLTALKLQLGEMAECTTAPQTALRKVESLTDDLVATVRRIALNLRPPLLDEFGLYRALAAHVDRFTAHTGIEVTITADAVCDRRFPLEVETAAFRIVQEGLTNVARHAGVSAASVDLTATTERLHIRLRDQGHGFDSSHRSPTGSGITGMQERVNLLGGLFSIVSRRSAGTTITASIPLAAAREG